MKKWKGNDEVFRTYVPGAGKEPRAGKLKGRQNIATFDEAEASGDFGGLLHPGLIDVSCDDEEMSKRLLDMIRANEWHCFAWMNPENGHLHSVWRNDQGRIKTNSGENKRLAVGLIADLHGGDTYIPLRVNGVDRFPPVYDVQPIQEIPEELSQVSARVELWNRGEGGRNSALSSAARYMARSTYYGADVIRRILTNTNRFVFAEPLSDSELQTILRDDTFRDVREFVPLETGSALDLYYEDIPSVEFVVEGLIPVGLTILASPPKFGKSFMCLNMALAAASGDDFMGFATNQCSVLYLALEDRRDRLKKRMTDMLDGGKPSANFVYATECATIGEGLVEQLEQFLHDHPKVKLLIVDTFVKVRGESLRNESAYKTDSREAGILKHFADQHGIAVLLVTHTRKGVDQDDPFVNISGTYGIAGAADDLIVLSRDKRNDQITRMSITGRDVEENDLAIARDQATGRWMLLSNAYDQYLAQQQVGMERLEYKEGNIRRTLIRLLEENDGSWTGACSGIIEASRDYSTPIALTSQKLGKWLSGHENFLYEDRIVHTEISRGEGQSKKHKFEIVL